MSASKKFCDLCGFDLGRNPSIKIYNGIEKKFCCHGCRFVYDLFIESGQYTPDSFVKSKIFNKYVDSGFIRPAAGKENIPENHSQDKIQSETINFKIEGMWCSTCSELIDYVLSGTNGVFESKTNFAADLSSITFSPYKISPNEIISKIKKIGYYASELNSDPKQKKETGILLIRTGIAAVLALNIMMLNIVFYPHVVTSINSAESQFVSWLLLIFTTPAIFYIGAPVLRKAWNDLKFGYSGMEVLISIGILTSYFYSVFVMFSNPYGELYFDTAVNLLALVLVGKMIESFAKSRATRDISVLYQSIPSKIRVVKNSTEKFLNIKEVQIGTEFIIKEGEAIPIDGLIIDGSGLFDEAFLTGESKAIEKKAGGNILSGSILRSGFIKAKVMNEFSASLLNQIIKSIESAMNSKPQIRKLTDLISKFFTPIIFFIALSTFIYAYLIIQMPLNDCIIRGISIVVIACPCAMAIAIPLALMLGISTLARKGIIIKSGDIFELKKKRLAVIFDKTGTITKGNFRMLGFKNISNLSDYDFLSIINSIEKKSSHPLAKAITEYLATHLLDDHECTNYNFLQGLGIECQIHDVLYRLGKKSFSNQKSDDSFYIEVSQLKQSGYNIVYFSRKDEIIGWLWLGDELNDSSEMLINNLYKDNIELHLISGDDENIVSLISKKMNINNFKGDMLPTDKIKYIKNLHKKGYKTIMVGDGINDGPSLVESDIGIAVNSGTDLAKISSQVVLFDNDLTKIYTFLKYSGKVRKIIIQNLIWALGYNISAIYLAVVGALNPLIAVLAMLFSSISVLINSLRLKKI